MVASSTITVSNASQLQTALASAHSGETILLAPGNYGSLTIYERNFTGGSVTIAAASSSQSSVLTGLHVNQSSGFVFSGIELNGSSATAAYSNTVTNSSDITFTNLTVHGNLSSGGIEIQNSSEIAVLNSNFHNLANGIGELNNTNINISGNAFSYVEGDGIDNAGVTGVSITNNTFTDFYGGSSSSHPDAIQFWTTGTNHSSSDININNNTITIGSGAQIQGVFMTDQIGNLPYENVNIAGNTIVGESWNGITVNHAQSLTVSDNEVIGLTDSGLTLQAQTSFGVAASSGIGLTNVNDATLAGNNSSGYSFSGDSNIGMNANAINGVLQQKVVYSAIGGTLTNLETELVLTGNRSISGTADAAGQTVVANNAGDRIYDSSAGSDALIGGSGNDTLISRNPSNTLTGGGGNNTFEVMNTVGNTTITDFNLTGTHNTLNISTLLNEGLHPSVTADGNNTVISFTGSTDTITLLGVHANELIASSSGFHN